MGLGTTGVGGRVGVGSRVGDTPVEQASAAAVKTSTTRQARETREEMRILLQPSLSGAGDPKSSTWRAWEPGCAGLMMPCSSS